MGAQQYDRAYGSASPATQSGGQYGNLPGQYATMPVRSQREQPSYGEAEHVGTLSAQAEQAG